MGWQDVPKFYADLRTRKAMAAKALMFTCLTGSRTGEVLGLRWEEINFETQPWTCPADRMKTGEAHRVPLTDEMLSIIEPLKELCVRRSKAPQATVQYVDAHAIAPDGCGGCHSSWLSLDVPRLGI